MSYNDPVDIVFNGGAHDGERFTVHPKFVRDRIVRAAVVETHERVPAEEVTISPSSEYRLRGWRGDAYQYDLGPKSG